MEYTINASIDHDGLEVYFNEKPDAGIRQALKGLRMRWHSVKKCWYGMASENAIKSAIGDGLEPASPVSTPCVEERSLMGVKVGDLFYASWGYDQTNVDFFQVVGICGTQSVRVREVHPRRISDSTVSSMSSDRCYEVTNELLPPSSNSVFINDNERGDIRRLRVDANGNNPTFNVGRRGGYCTTVRRYSGEELYESWYA